MPRLSIVIPVRAGGNADITLSSLERSVFSDFDIIVQHDQWESQSRCRNEGAKLVSPDTDLLLFSDDDIEWLPGGIYRMVAALDAKPEAAFAYGWYEMGGRIICNQPFNSRMLRQRNYISTMSVMRRHLFTGFDERLHNLEDWELWLRLSEAGHFGAYTGTQIFSTAVRNGVTRGGRMKYEEAYQIIRSKHNL